jgi:GT2 family glycosyltransferase
MKRIAVLIPVFNHLAYTRKCIGQLKNFKEDRALENSEIHVVLIDDGSSDGTSEWVKEAHPWVHLLHGDGNLWWSGGINMGAQFAYNELKADFLLLWNNDTQAAEDYFRQLDRIVSELDGRTVVGSKIYSAEMDQVVWAYGGFFNARTGKKYLIGSGEPDSEAFRQIRKVDWLPGMGTLLPISVIDDVGYWNDKDFPQYFGDSDYTIRVNKAGYVTQVFPQLKIWNDNTNTGLSHKGSLKGLWHTLTGMKSASKISTNFKFFSIHGSSPLAYRYPLTYYFRIIGGFFKWKVLSLFGMRKERRGSA